MRKSIFGRSVASWPNWLFSSLFSPEPITLINWRKSSISSVRHLYQHWMKYVNHVSIIIIRLSSNIVIRWSNFLIDARDYINKLPTKPKQDYVKLFGYKYDGASRTPVSGVSPQGIALLDRLLSFDHRTRPTAEQALCMSFMSVHLPSSHVSPCSWSIFRTFARSHGRTVGRITRRWTSRRQLSNTKVEM